jgi:TATA-binding protein-associated factor
MPSFSVSTALALAHGTDGVPWDIDAWKDITGVQCGLFPEDDNSLPPGMSRSDAKDIATYFDVLHKKGTQEKQLKFSRARDHYVGRRTWNDWVSKRYKKWGLHDLTVKAMKDSSCHPHMIMKADEADTWPDADVVANLAQPAVGLALFGSDGLTSLNMVKPALRTLVNAIVLRTLDALKSRFNRTRNNAEVYREKAENAYLGIYRTFTRSTQALIGIQKSQHPGKKSLRQC